MKSRARARCPCHGSGAVPTVSLVSAAGFGFAERVPYRVAPIFLIRMAGVAFDPVERLATREMSTAAREVLARRSDVAAAVTSVDGFLDSQRDMLSKDLVRAWRKVLRTGAGVPVEPHIDPFNAYRQAVSASAIAENNLDQKLQTELQNARAVLLRIGEGVFARLSRFR